MVLGVVLQLVSECSLRSFSVLEFVGSAGRGGDKITKVRVERVVDVGNQNIWAEARCRAAGGVIPVNNGRCERLQRIEFMHPSRRLGVLVCENVGDLSVRVFGYS